MLKSGVGSFKEKFDELDVAIIRWMSLYGISLLRIALGVVFIWFGALKVLRVSPVADLVAQTVYWLPTKFAVPFLGFWEMIVGLGLIFGRALRTVLLLLFLQMSGTFLVLILHPELSFQNGNLFKLTIIGEFVIKNIVLISAGLVIGSTVKRPLE